MVPREGLIVGRSARSVTEGASQLPKGLLLSRMSQRHLPDGRHSGARRLERLGGVGAVDLKPKWKAEPADPKERANL